MSRLRDPLIVAGLVVAALMACLLVAGLARHVITGGASAKTEARVAESQADAANASAAEAIAIIASGAASEAAIDAITLENDRAIRSAPGAGAPVDPGVAAAGLAGLCRRAAYLHNQRCLQFTPAP
jgi:multidrug efflux pump subunit AcrA (membrane-fusion protein)